MLQSQTSETNFSAMFFSPANRARLILILTALLFPAFVSSVFSQAEKDPVRLFNQGQDAHEKGDFAAALKLYDEAVEILPEFPEAEFQRGAALQSLGRAAEAEKAFRRALELRENWILPMISLGSLLTNRTHFQEAETLLNKAIELDESNSSAYAALAHLRLKTKAAPVVLKDLLAKFESLKNKPDASVWAARAALERALGDLSAAKNGVRNALALEPNNSSAVTEAVEIALAEKDFPAALEAAQNLVRLSPASQTAKILLARVYAESGNFSESAALLDVLDANDADVAALRDFIMLRETKDIPALEKQLEKNPKSAMLLGKLCTTARVSAPAKALDYCRRASEAEPNNLNHAVGFGAALVQAKQFETAVALFRRILQIAPDEYAAHANLATALFGLKRFAEAKTEYLWLVAKKPLPIAYYFLAISHDNLAEYTEALTNYRQFLETADAKQNGLEIEKVNLRLPSLQKLIEQNDSRKGQKP